MNHKSVFYALIIGLMFGLTACSGSAESSPTPTPTVLYSQYQLEYLLLAKYPNVFWNDPDLYPIARAGHEETNSAQQFPSIQANNSEFAAILEHLGLPVKPDYTEAEKLSIYREYKKLNRAVTLTPSGNLYDFSLYIGESQGQHITGTITSAGQITVKTTETSFNTHPICLSWGTLIDTPTGPIPVEQLQPGMLVCSVDTAGNRVIVPILKVSATLVPAKFQVVRITLNDGRTITASPGHPAADFRSLGEYRAGDILDRGKVISVEWQTYDAKATFDIRPAGTGQYWANDILLMSTLLLP
jgi:hypothetical protein